MQFWRGNSNPEFLYLQSVHLFSHEDEEFAYLVNK